MDSYQITFDTWNKLADLYQEKFMDLTIYHESYASFCQRLAGIHPRVLDIGCGPGNIAKQLLNFNTNIKLFGIDAAPNMVALARKNVPNAQFAVLDARNMTSSLGKFEGIVMGFCIPYLSIEDVDTLLFSCNEMVENGGVLYLSFVEGEAAQSGYQTGSTGLKTYFHYHSLNLIADLLMKYNWEQSEVFKIPFQKSNGQSEFHTVIIATKQ